MDVEALVSQVAPYTMIKRASLNALYTFVAGVTLPPGAVVQCGATNGGSAVLLWHAAGAGRRPLWMFDSFEGLPEPGEKDGGRAHAKWDYYQAAHAGTWCKGAESEARKCARMAEVPEKLTHTVKGWFKDTLPVWAGQVGPVALLYLDADWYQSTLECLEYLYPALAPGGLLMLDDYGYWPGCDQACKEYGIETKLTVTPPCGAYLVKEGR